MKQKTSRRITLSLTYLILAVVFIWVWFPIFWMISSSFMPQADQTTTLFPPLLPSSISLAGWKYLFVNLGALADLRNSFGIATISTGIVLAATIFSGYSLARFQFKGKTIAFNFLLLAQFIPTVANIVTLYVIFDDLHLVNTWVGMIILYTSSGTILGTLLFQGFFTGLPTSIEDAAMVDGTSRLGAFLRVILPLMMPGLLTVGLFTWIGCWGELQLANLFTFTDAARTLPVTLIQLETPYGTSNISAEFAIGTILAIPPLILFLMFQRYYSPTLTGGGFKG